MPSYNVHEAKSNFSKLMKQAEQGEEVIVMRDGEPVVKLVRCPTARRKKVQLGWAAAETRETPGWEKPMTDAEVDAWLGGK
jgi:prevent-host-death family protein